MSLAFGFALPHWQAISGGAFSPASLFAGGTVAGAWYDPSDLSTLFTTSAGTTQCAMPGQGSAVSVGLMLDKSKGSPLAVGAHRYWRYIVGVSTNQHHPRVSRIVLSTATASTDIVVFLADNCADQGTIPTLGATYAYDFGSATAIVSASVYATFNGSRAALYQVEYSDDNTNWFSAFQGNMSATTCGLFAGSVFAYNGNHAIAFNNTTARPELRARVNLLTYSEEFDNGAWVKFQSTISANTTATTDPFGGNTADKLIPNVGSTIPFVYNSAVASISGVQYTASVYVKAAELGFVFVVNNTRASSTQAGVCINLATGATSNDGANGTYTVTSAGNGWWQIAATTTATSTSGYLEIWPMAVAGTGGYTGDGTSGIYIWGADLRPANIGANVPAYQRIADANTYDTSGFPLYLFFDGIDDSMYTPANLNLSGTDKVAVFAGVRKLSDATTGMLAETSVGASSTNGAWLITAPDTATNRYGFGARGTSFAGVLTTSSTYNAPVSNVLTAIADISAPVTTLRANGAVAATSGTTLGAGNFGNHSLFIGTRNNTSFPFNGHLHSLIIAGSAVSAGNISATEQWVAGKTGIVIP